MHTDICEQLNVFIHLKIWAVDMHSTLPPPYQPPTLLPCLARISDVYIISLYSHITTI